VRACENELPVESGSTPDGAVVGHDGVLDTWLPVCRRFRRPVETVMVAGAKAKFEMRTLAPPLAGGGAQGVGPRDVAFAWNSEPAWRSAQA
jgi:hypothetical protein